MLRLLPMPHDMLVSTDGERIVIWGDIYRDRCCWWLFGLGHAWGGEGAWTVS